MSIDSAPEEPIFRMQTLTRKILQDDGDGECSYQMFALLFCSQ